MNDDLMIATYVDGHLIEMTEQQARDMGLTDNDIKYQQAVDSEYHMFNDLTVDMTEGEKYGSYEVFRILGTSDWYWWACLPGCLPDGDAVGPYASKAAAMADANRY